MKQFAVLNPANGGYTRVNSTEELVSVAAQLALAFYLDHTHQQPFSIVEVAEDGSEKWFSPEGSQILSPQEFEAELAREMAEAALFQNAAEPQPVVAPSTEEPAP